MAIHYIHVDDGAAATLSRSDFVGQVGKVRSQNGATKVNHRQSTSYKVLAPTCTAKVLELVTRLALAAAGEPGPNLRSIRHRHNPLHIRSSRVQNLGPRGLLSLIGQIAFRELAMRIGHGLRIAKRDPSSAIQDAAYRPGPIVFGEENLAGALLLRAVIPAPQKREMIAERTRIWARRCLFLQSPDNRGGPRLRAL